MARDVNVYLIRHAKAGSRQKWTAPDHLRPLTKPGMRQARMLVELLCPETLARVVSSPYVRCVQTVEPLARARGLEVALDPALEECAPLREALDLIEHASGPLAACTHGDVMEYVIAHLQAQGVPEADPMLCQKGSTWVLQVEQGKVLRARYLPPPD